MYLYAACFPPAEGFGLAPSKGLVSFSMMEQYLFCPYCLAYLVSGHVSLLTRGHGLTSVPLSLNLNRIIRQGRERRSPFTDSLLTGLVASQLHGACLSRRL